MKSIQFLLFVGILVSIGTLSAQKIQFGLQAGPVMTQIATPNKPDIDPRINHSKLEYQAGVIISYETAARWGVSFEPGIIRKGSNQQLGQNNSDIRLAYLQAPILLSYQVLPKFRILAGPELSFLLDVTYEDEVGAYDMNVFYDRDAELAALVGLQYRPFEKIELGLRMSHALTYSAEFIWRGVSAAEIARTKEYNQYLQLLIRVNL